MTMPDLTWTCHICSGQLIGGLDTIHEHAATHGYEPERWADGEPVVDMSDVPELLDGPTAI